MDHVAFIDFPRRIKTVISNLRRFFHAQKEISGDSFVHVLAELRFAEVHAFFQVFALGRTGV